MDDTDATDYRGFIIRENPYDPCYPCAINSMRMAAN